MKTLCKKLLTGCLALAMACAMAIPTFAAEPQTRANIYQSYAIQSQTQGSTFMRRHTSTLRFTWPPPPQAGCSAVTAVLPSCT